MRRASNPSITPQMYRHFAVVTVILTATMAFFASGENDQAAAAHAAQARAAHVRPTPPPEPAFKQAEPAADDAGTWGSDDGGSFGGPTMAVPSSGGSQWLPPPLAGIGNVQQAITRAGAADDPENEADDAAPTAAEIAAAQAASRLRSGAGRGEQ
jgi:hypothetical protein